MFCPASDVEGMIFASLCFIIIGRLADLKKEIFLFDG